MSLRMKEACLTIVALITLVLLAASAHAQTYNPTTSSPSQNTAGGTGATPAGKGQRNTAFGMNAGKVMGAGGTDNTFVGSESGSKNTGGDANVGVGQSSLKLNSSGGFNTGVGFYACPSVTTGVENVCLGWGSGANLTTGSGNVYIASPGAAANESDTVRIGTTAHVIVIEGALHPVFGGLPLVIDPNTGQIGYKAD